MKSKNAVIFAAACVCVFEGLNWKLLRDSRNCLRLFKKFPSKKSRQDSDKMQFIVFDVFAVLHP